MGRRYCGGKGRQRRKKKEGREWEKEERGRRKKIWGSKREREKEDMGKRKEGIEGYKEDVEKENKIARGRE